MKKAFTLIEVCLVMMIFGIAVTSLLSLFPVGLRQGNEAASDSQVTMFADYIMNSLHARASEITDWETWDNKSDFRDALIEDIEFNSKDNSSLVCGREVSVTLKGDDDEGIKPQYFRYLLLIKPVGPTGATHVLGNSLYNATLWVSDNKIGEVRNGRVFSTFFSFSGEVK